MHVGGVRTVRREDALAEGIARRCTCNLQRGVVAGCPQHGIETDAAFLEQVFSIGAGDEQRPTAGLRRSGQIAHAEDIAVLVVVPAAGVGPADLRRGIGKTMERRDVLEPATLTRDTHERAEHRRTRLRDARATIHGWRIETDDREIVLRDHDGCGCMHRAGDVDGVAGKSDRERRR